METILAKIEIFFPTAGSCPQGSLISLELYMIQIKIFSNHSIFILLVPEGKVPWKEKEWKHLIAENIFK